MFISYCGKHDEDKTSYDQKNPCNYCSDPIHCWWEKESKVIRDDIFLEECDSNTIQYDDYDKSCAKSDEFHE